MAGYLEEPGVGKVEGKRHDGIVFIQNNWEANSGTQQGGKVEGNVGKLL